MERIFSGIQPTGEVHLGNYLGALVQWVDLQRKAEAFFCIVDYHAITVPQDSRALPGRVLQLAAALLGVGLDPDRCTLFAQSHVSEHCELAWILACRTPLGDLSRMTQFKEKSPQERGKASLGLLAYPVLQAADILLYRAGAVPVGEDQVQHLELSREIARRFNRAFGETFPEPKALLTGAKRVLGLDGSAKMSKSKGNTIALLDPPEVVEKKILTAVTDPARVRRKDPGEPARCNLFRLHEVFTPRERREEIAAGCRTAGLGCVDCKRILLEGLRGELDPVRERIQGWLERPDEVHAVLEAGARKASVLAAETMETVRRRIGVRA